MNRSVYFDLCVGDGMSVGVEMVKNVECVSGDSGHSHWCLTLSKSTNNIAYLRRFAEIAYCKLMNRNMKNVKLLKDIKPLYLLSYNFCTMFCFYLFFFLQTDKIINFRYWLESYHLNWKYRTSKRINGILGRYYHFVYNFWGR